MKNCSLSPYVQVIQSFQTYAHALYTVKSLGYYASISGALNSILLPTSLGSGRGELKRVRLNSVTRLSGG